MKQLVALWQVTRMPNLIIMAATMCLSYYCFTDYLTLSDLTTLKFLLLCTSVILTAAAGYIINDYLDVSIDLTNKPNKVIIGKTISRRWAMLLHFSFNGIAILLGCYIKISIGFIVALCTVALWLYSVYYKKMFLLGNLLVAALSAFVIAILPWFNEQTSVYLVWVYSIFAFGISLIREIVKDAEDLRGDDKFNCKTLPIVLGIRKTKKILITLVIIYIFLIVAHLTLGFSFIGFRHRYNHFFYAIYMALAVIIPLCCCIYLLYKADVKRDFRQLSGWCKFIMLTGLLSMLLIKW